MSTSLTKELNKWIKKRKKQKKKQKMNTSTVSFKRTKAKYREYLKSQDWKFKRKKKLSKSKKRCAICGWNEMLDVHHVAYKNWYDVTTGDLRIMCRVCHDLIHKLENEGKIKYKSNNPNSRYGAQKSAVTKYRKQMAPKKKDDIPKQEKHKANEGILTKEIFNAGKSSRGGWGWRQLKLLGVEYPLKKGWKKRIIGTEVGKEKINEFLALKDRHLKNKATYIQQEQE